MKRFIFVLFFCVVGALQPAAAYAGDTIDSIEVTGIKRIEKNTILSYMTIHEGDEFDSAEINNSLKSLFATGLFSDISLIRKGDTLIVDVIENPIINEIAFEGNDKVEDKALMAEIRSRPRVVYTRARVQEDVRRLMNIYQRSGRFSTVIEPKIIVLDQNRVNLVFEINEGKKTYIQNIHFVGNKHFSDDVLKNEIISSETSWYNFLSSTDTYDPDRLNYDEELLRRFYLAKGYADFKVESTIAELSPDKDDFFVTFAVHEGERYHFGKINIENHLKGIDVKTLRDTIDMSEGDWYNASQVDDVVLAMTDAAADMQFGFVNIRPVVDLDRANRLVNLTFQVNESPRVFIGNINIKGNVRTLDKVIRREFLFAEGDPYNQSKIKKSEQEIRNLDFFETVKVEPKKTAVPDRADIDVTVSEKSTGELSLGGGFSTEDGPLADFHIRERNLMGTGRDLLLRTTLSGKTQQFDISFTEPYFLNRDLSAGIDLYHKTRDYQKESSYDLKRTGAGLRLGYPLSRNWRQVLRYSAMTNEIQNVQGDASTYIKQQEGRRVTSKIGQDLTYDVRDNTIDPTDGYIVGVSFDVAGLGGDAQYLSTEAKAARYFPVFEDSVFSVAAQGGYIVGYGGEDVTIAERFFVGGSKLRGFASGGIGPRDSLTTDSLGGNQYVVGSVEYATPLGVSKDMGLKWHLFTDAGTLWGVDDTGSNIQDSNSLRVASGFGMSWQSPMGPIRVDFAFPIMSEDYDKNERFRFSFGTRF